MRRRKGFTGALDGKTGVVKMDLKYNLKHSKFIQLQDSLIVSKAV